MTEWFTKKPGDVVLQGDDDPAMLIVGADVPDWVRLPSELGGAQLRVEGAHAAPCPRCRAPEPVRHLVLADLYGVAECPACAFVWYRRR
jgi:hypothetical protein